MLVEGTLTCSDLASSDLRPKPSAKYQNHSVMKNLHRGMLLAMLCLSISFSSCYQSKSLFDGVLTPNCKQFSIGSICFHNPYGKTAKVEIKNSKMEVFAFSTLCMDLYEGEYEYKVKNDGNKWKADVDIRSCREEKIELKKCEDC